MIYIYTGLPGSGKTLKLASVALRLLRRNRRYFLKTSKKGAPIRRLLYTNIPFCKRIEDYYGIAYKNVYGKDGTVIEQIRNPDGFIVYWTELEEVYNSRHCDVIWQEMAAYLDSNDYKIVPRELKRWLQLHRHYGVDIFGDTQDFPMIDISVRRLANKVYRLVKLFGSRDKSATRPVVKHIWGLTLMLMVDPQTFAEDKQDYKYLGWYLFKWGKYLCSIFDSYQDLSYSSYPPLKHIDRKCSYPGCTKRHLIHV